jgi:uncharacterized protein
MKHISWDEAVEASEALADKVASSGFKPDFIVGITLGGLIPLTLIAKRLALSDVLTIYAKSYNKFEQKELVVKYRPNVDLKNKRVLLVDEIADSGETLRAISKIFTDEYGADLKTAVLVKKNSCPIEPDFWIIPTDEWVAFPWDETIS